MSKTVEPGPEEKLLRAIYGAKYKADWAEIIPDAITVNGTPLVTYLEKQSREEEKRCTETT